ncbi:MAG: patatin-like phospholipase family protein [Terriglobales bacterium]
MPETERDPCDQPLATRPADCPVTFATVLEKEIDQIKAARKARGVSAEKTQDSLIGLAFSGGGIRSATFNLGILQALARRELLHKFDYLSTVSGGGYVGSWLAAVTKRYLANVPGSSFKDVEKALVPEDYQPGARHERSFLRWLRLYSNYLTPHSGAFSLDTWAMIGTWSRNCFLNQTILGLLFLGFFVLCDVMLLALVRSWGLGWDMVGWGCIVLFAAAVAMGFSVVDQTLRKDISKSWFQRVKVTMTVMMPFLAASVLLNSGLWRLAVSEQYALRFGRAVPAIFEKSPWYWAAGGAIFYFVVWALVALFVALRTRFTGKQHDGMVSLSALLFSSAVAGAISASLLREYAVVLTHLKGSPAMQWTVIALGPGAVVLILLSCGAFHQGITGRGCRDLVREWWARLGGYMMLATLGWLLLTAICAFGPLLVRWALFKLETWSIIPALLWLLHNYLGVRAASSATTSGKPGKPRKPDDEDAGLMEKAAASVKSPRILDLIAKAAPYVFATGLFLLLATAVHVGAGLAFAPDQTTALWHLGADSPAASGSAAQSYTWPALSQLYWKVQHGGQGPRSVVLPPMLLVAGVLWFACLLLSLRVDVNDFSLHHFYRNRLVRCYLGASNPKRKPQPFTGFDPNDDVALADLAAGYPGPYPLLNAALNITGGGELGYASRRAKSFVFSPLFCGYEVNVPGHGESWFLRENSEGPTFANTFSPTGQGRTKSSFSQITSEDGIALGTAMAISGAAASPNMGYYTSAATGLFMTLFDVRLGWWMGNPRYRSKWRSPGPRLGLWYLFSELIAQSDQKKSYVYLSDGGHFENLAVYELLRRHCRLIVACDADCDDQYQCQNLVDLMEKARTDLGAEINIDFRQIRPDGGGRESQHNFVVGDIYYDPQDPTDRGKFLYIKASMPQRPKTPSATMRHKENILPDDVWQYFDKHQTFPHQSTADQWFDELQFESYRALGEFIGIEAAERIKELLT